MIATSTVLMFGLTYLTTSVPSHIDFSQTRAWMALVMGAAMAVVMFAFMHSTYRDRSRNVAVVALAAVVFAGALWLVRTVDDVAWMKAMIPHHSIAILTSERAHLSDPRVQALAHRTADTQRREIAAMQALVAELDASRR